MLFWLVLPTSRIEDINEDVNLWKQKFFGFIKKFLRHTLTMLTHSKSDIYSDFTLITLHHFKSFSKNIVAKSIRICDKNVGRIFRF